eukprot:4867317-Alexandrium_andersonii.AAC.1
MPQAACIHRGGGRRLLSRFRLVSHGAFPGGLRPPGPPREAPPARPPDRAVIAIGLSARNDAEPPGRGL